MTRESREALAYIGVWGFFSSGFGLPILGAAHLIVTGFNVRDVLVIGLGPLFLLSSFYLGTSTRIRLWIERGIEGSARRTME